MQRRDFVMSAVGLIRAARLGTAKELKRDVIPITTTGFVDVSVSIEALLERCPTAILKNESAKAEWVQECFRAIIQSLEKIGPGECYVHPTYILRVSC